ncbi:hypothetical protein CDHC02_0143 [Corynebacterium diphtheriae HC02]|nr:hypothetical protein CDHC02_0143 [Corynebacterium diphtheriae HC02]AEX77840.1 hypothetical protein CDHC03_0109 [Corynebacterium diphtheriae HC03]
MCTINPSPCLCHVIAFFNEVDINFVDGMSTTRVPEYSDRLNP